MKPVYFALFTLSIILALSMIFNSSFLAKEANEKNIAMVLYPGWTGELELAYRVQKACDHIGWRSEIIVEKGNESIEEEKYDFVISLSNAPYKTTQINSYLTLFHPKHHYFDNRGYLKHPYDLFDGHLITYPLGDDKKDFEDSNRHPWMLWFPTVHRVDYTIVDPSYLCHFCRCRLYSMYGNKIHLLLQYLDNKNYVRFYGPEKLKNEYKRYFGFLPHDGVSLLNAISEAGVCLILHGQDHLIEGLPSGRIFEAAASSAVIICDKNAFVMEHFGDSVLYIDEKNSAESMFAQIQEHMQWIQANKTKALEMAEKAHSIVVNKFSLEDQLIRLGDFHDDIVRNKSDSQR